jgi:hypothetical protein
MPVRVNAPGLYAARAAFRGLPRDLKNTIRRSQRAEIGPIWKEEMARSVGGGTGTQQRVFKTGTTVKAGLPAYLVAGSGSRPLSGGGIPRDMARAVELGSGRRGKYTRYDRKARGATKATKVVRRTSAQLPTHNRSGYVVFPAVAQAVPRIIGTWVKGLTDRIYDAVDGR